ncbi:MULTISPECIES: D-alanyl-D-alanine carboxypeptidase family protein [unclassified Oscillibacter]|uniref:D-alanyl-D-alanine carboxypeptidase family protein n=1 Tax=unclassified Oscillibacter TaxID=2629304 RepID=UPI0025D77CD7|nr:MULTISPECIES: D-alanyl-D-alanine carboxypeptidase family protein [unclassified Oscillibacter]
MKIKRFLSAFLLLMTVVGFCAVPAAADEIAPAPDPGITAKAALLIDSETGSVLYQKNEHAELYPASLTKIMTALLTLEAIDQGKLSLDQELTASASALTGLASDGSSAGIQVGETMSVENYLKCMLVVSANEACDVLAEAVSGSVADFVDAMNAKAEALGCKNTHFANPNGLHDSQHYTSAWDLYLITLEAMKYPEFMAICDMGVAEIPATNLSPVRRLRTTNYLLSNWRAVGYVYSDAHGIKTGSTSEAGHCLVSSATKGSRTLISVVLGADRVVGADGVADVRSFSETKRLFEWGFINFSMQTVLSDLDMLADVKVDLSKIDSVAVHPADRVELLLPNHVKSEELERKLDLPEIVNAPVTAGQELGSVELSLDGTVYATVPLVALNSVEASKLLTFWFNVQQFFSRMAVKAALIVLGILVLLGIGWKLTLGRRRYRYGKPSRRARGYRGRRR